MYVKLYWSLVKIFATQKQKIPFLKKFWYMYQQKKDGFSV